MIVHQTIIWQHSFPRRIRWGMQWWSPFFIRQVCRGLPKGLTGMYVRSFVNDHFRTSYVVEAIKWLLLIVSRRPVHRIDALPLVFALD